ncbi:metallophosphoesterase [Candidatus Sumerlaeota bacterium]|nr:metallophosphoesterase [Candidatus Sumerlaeota bacterium]
MRILITSDLHYEVTGHEAIRRLVAGMEREEPDALVLAGDIGNPSRLFEHCLALFVRMNCPVAVLPGNHDLWRSPGETSAALHEELLPAITRDCGFHWLPDEPMRLPGGTAIAGNIAWYDYSARDMEAPATEEQVEEEKRFFCNDANNVDWEFTDREFAARCRKKLTAQCQALEHDPGVRAIVVVTHVPIMKGQMEWRPDDARWNFRNAYFGHLTLGNELKSLGKLHWVVSGHTHLGLSGAAEREGLPPIATSVIPSDYGKPRWVTVEV